MSNWKKNKISKTADTKESHIKKTHPKRTHTIKTQTASYKIGIVTAHFNNEITDELLSGSLKQLKKMGIKEKSIYSVRVPGAVEIPLAASWLIENGADGVITLGCVIRGETAHFDYVCQSVERGCTLLQIEKSRPVVFGVLTTENLKQAQDRIGGVHGHKGEEAAETLIEMLNLKKSLFSKKIFSQK